MKKTKRILAMAGVILLAAMYIITLLLALFDNSHGLIMFKASILTTVLVPVLLWGYALIYRLAKGKEDDRLKETLEKLDSEKGKKETET